MIDRREALRLGFTASLLPVIGRRAKAAEQKTILKASDVHPEGYPTVQAVENMGKKLEAATGGRLSVQMYASMQLGGEKEAIEQAQVGALQLARVSVGALGPVVDDLNVFNLPFLFRDTAHMDKIIDGRSARNCSTRSPKARTRTSSVSPSWMRGRATFTTPRNRSKTSPTSRV